MAVRGRANEEAIVSLCLCLLLTVCLTAEERMEAARQQNAAQDDEKCQSSGAKPGEAAYVRCRGQLALLLIRSWCSNDNLKDSVRARPLKGT
jgi:hypothetical protein